MADRNRGLDPNDPMFIDAGHNMPQGHRRMHAIAPAYIRVNLAAPGPGSLRVHARARRVLAPAARRAPAALRAAAVANDAAVQQVMILTMVCVV